eukprot:CAMPEP_0183334916 /NCGR_PEP_ID=MMETSP0164_2-20130417/3370_1 /TAXON_ID=221442 /ORGANISM="Coccolithus pelagicus ssp braarudi, Strain PLY182g" /LENGTH=44 /DNA_ID= /DNA_START= /DNA_END= /DNA_ORIENTATION=
MCSAKSAMYALCRSDVAKLGGAQSEKERPHFSGCACCLAAMLHV